jgi:sialic acid synthase SpsE
VKLPVHGGRAYLIAEVGSNHDRDPAVARALIDATAEAGWDAVKFQLFRAAWLYPSNCGVVDTPEGRVDFYEVLGRAELPPEWLPDLRAHAERAGVDFLCTPFDEAAVAQLDGIGVAAFKIASPELNHLPLLRAAARAGRPLLCSTGLCTLADVEEALSTIRAARPAAEVALFHCTTAYPTPPGEANLGAIDTLHRAFGVPVGLSDHTLDPELAPAVSVAVGGCLIEKHVTLGRTRPGPDHSFAIEPPEMRRLAGAVRALDALPVERRLDEARRRFGAAPVDAAVGHGRKEIMPCEAPLYPCDKRSIHAIADAPAGAPLSPANVRILRSERNLTPGLHPRHWEEILGARLTRPLRLGEGLTWSHLVTR